MPLLKTLVRDLAEAVSYRCESNFLYTMHPVWKIILVPAILTVTLLLSDPIRVLVIVVMLLVIGFSGVGAHRFIRTVTSITVFTVLLLVFSLVYVAVQCKLGGDSRSALLGVATGALKFYSIALSFSILFTTTRLMSIARILEKVGVPYRLVYPLTLAVRYMSIVLLDFENIYDVQRLRGVELDKGGLLTRAKNLLSLFTPLIVLSVERLDDITFVLENRGFGVSKKRTYAFREKLRIQDALFTGLTVLLLILLLLL